MTLDAGIRATGKLAEVATCDALLLVAPAQHVRSVAKALRPSLRRGQPVVICAKGLEQSSGKMMGDVVEAELARGDTRGVVRTQLRRRRGARIADGAHHRLRRRDGGAPARRALGSPKFRLYWTSDLVGVELGGALKNVLAIAAGIVDGQGLGASAHAALVTRGFAEMRRFGKALGARPETLIGLSGLGDLILTCGSPQSRNMSLGRALGRGETLAQALAGKLAVTEGVYTATAVCRIAEEKGIDMPISTAVCDVIDGRIGVKGAIEQLMQRPFKAED